MQILISLIKGFKGIWMSEPELGMGEIIVYTMKYDAFLKDSALMKET